MDYKPNRAGIRSLLKSAETQQMIAAKTEAVAAATRSRTSSDVVTFHDVGRTRARGTVMLLDGGAAEEANTRPLGSSLDAAR